jgi:hypothetical protein
LINQDEENRRFQTEAAETTFAPAGVERNIRSAAA